MERYTRKNAQAAFERLIAAIGGLVATSYKDDGAYTLDWNAMYGGGVIERISGDRGGVSQPFGMQRRNARERQTMNYIQVLQKLDRTLQYLKPRFAQAFSLAPEERIIGKAMHGITQEWAKVGCNCGGVHPDHETWCRDKGNQRGKLTRHTDVRST